MSKHINNRIYKYLSEPLQFLGFSIDEIAITALGIYFSKFTPTMIHKFIFLACVIGFVMLIKRLKKLIEGFSFMSFLHWYFGVDVAGKGADFPHSSKRKWIV